MRKLNFDKLHIASKGRMRDINEVIVLNLIRDKQSVSRVEIARKTGLQISTVTVITKRLIEKGLVHEQGVAPSNGGRRPRLLALRAEKACVFGIDIGVTKTTLAIGDFNGAIIHREILKTGRRPHPFINKLIDKIEHLTESQKDRFEFEGIGVSATGVIDSANGKITFSPNLGWKDIDIQAIFERRLPLPIYINNDARSSALAEAWHGNGKHTGSMNLVFVTVNEGVGAGIILNGQLFRGSSDGAGEFGHLSLDHNGPLCNCGNRGCWELYSSDRATIERFLGLSEKIKRLYGGEDYSSVDMRGLVALAEGGNKEALSSLKTTAKYLALGIANIVNSLNPEMVVIGGEITSAWSILEPVIHKTLKPKVFARNFASVHIAPSSLKENASLEGALLQALSTKLSVGKVA